jgi:hypothetical protein
VGTRKPRLARRGFSLPKLLKKGLLRLGDLAAFDAAGADPDALRCAIDQSLNRLQIHIPTATGDVVCVRDVVAELRPFAADIACLCHDVNSRILNGNGT